MLATDVNHTWDGTLHPLVPNFAMAPHSLSTSSGHRSQTWCAYWGYENVCEEPLFFMSLSSTGAVGPVTGNHLWGEKGGALGVLFHVLEPLYPVIEGCAPTFHSGTFLKYGEKRKKKRKGKKKEWSNEKNQLGTDASKFRFIYLFIVFTPKLFFLNRHRLAWFS